MTLVRRLLPVPLFCGLAMAAAAQQAQTFPGTSLPSAGSSHVSLLKPLGLFNFNDPFVPLRASGRVRWFISSTIGPSHLAAGLFTSAFGTMVNRPEEYGPHWGGFAERYGIRMTGIVTGNAMEAGLGAIWGEDPRYFRVPDEHFGSRIKNAAKQTFLARYRNGDLHPAYARFIAVAGNNFLSNTWREPSEANNRDALIRTLEGIGGRMGANLFQEFWPDIQRKIFHRGD